MINQPLDILASNESKLDDNDSDNMLSLHGYTLVRRDRNKKGGESGCFAANLFS